MHGWMLSSNAIMLYEYCKSNHCVFHSSVINDCISWCRYPSEMGVKFTGFRTYHSYNRLHCNKLFYECIILCIHPVRKYYQWGREIPLTNKSLHVHYSVQHNIHIHIFNYQMKPVGSIVALHDKLWTI